MSEEERVHQELWESINKVSLDDSEEDNLNFKVRGQREATWGLIRNPENKIIIGLSLSNRDFMEVNFNTSSSSPTLYFYRPKEGRHGIKERLEFSHHSIVIRSNKQPWNFSDWALDEVFSF